MKVPVKLLPIVSIPGFHFSPLTATVPTSTQLSTTTATAIPVPPKPCLDVSITNYLTNGSLSVSLSRDNSLECYILRYSPQNFQRKAQFYNLNMTCLDENVTAILKENVAVGAPDELYVDYFAEDGTEVFFEMRPMPEDQWLVEDGAVYKTYHDSAGC
jgi:hypothetical protein